MAMHLVRIHPSFLFNQSLYFLKRPNGVVFTAVPGTAEFVKRWEPKIGDIVSFKHRGFLLASKKPRLPALFRLRPDLTWDDVVSNWREQKPSSSGTDLFKLSIFGN